MAKVLDYSNARLPVAELARLVRTGELAGVMRYDGAASWPKALTAAELGQYVDAGVPCGNNYETTGRSWRGGHAQGFLDGQQARAWAHAIGWPEERPIAQSIDESVPPEKISVALDYQHGFNEGGELGPQGCYATKPVLEAMLDNGLIRVAWQINARAFYGNHDDCPRAALIQHVSHSFPQFPAAAYDESSVQLPDWGQHPAPIATPTGPILGDDDMHARFHDDTHTQLPGADRCALVNSKGDVILVDGASIADSNPMGPAMKTIMYLGLTVVLNDAPADETFGYATELKNGAGQTVGFRCRYSDTKGNWHPRVRMFRG